jgi:hypothetical protein
MNRKRAMSWVGQLSAVLIPSALNLLLSTVAARVIPTKSQLPKFALNLVRVFALLMNLVLTKPKGLVASMIAVVYGQQPNVPLLKVILVMKLWLVLASAVLLSLPAVKSHQCKPL